MHQLQKSTEDRFRKMDAWEQELNKREEQIQMKLQQIKQEFKSEHSKRTPSQNELENIRQLLESKNEEIEILQREIEETDREARAGRAALNWLKKDLEKKNEGVKALGSDLEKRNLETSEMRKQLVDNQTTLTDKNKMIDQLQTEFGQMKSELLAKNEELRQVKTGQRELEIKNEIQRLVGENLQEKIRSFNEISKGSNIVDDNIKTEKFDDEE
jgi:chromosome segregation protein